MTFGGKRIRWFHRDGWFTLTLQACAHPLHRSEREKERERERDVEYGYMDIEFISLLLTMAALQIKNLNVFSNSLTRNKFFNCPELTGPLGPFSY